MNAGIQELWFAELPARQRLGLKGPRAAAWLADRGVPVPAQANSAVISGEAESSLLVARLGTAEFLLEGGGQVADMKSALGASAPGVYAVLREDRAFELGGARVHEVLTQVCNVDLAALSLATQPVVMTMMAGVAVLILPQQDTIRRFRLWCDPSFGTYLRETLAGIVIECGGQTR